MQNLAKPNFSSFFILTFLGALCHQGMCTYLKSTYYFLYTLSNLFLKKSPPRRKFFNYLSHKNQFSQKPLKIKQNAFSKIILGTVCFPYSKMYLVMETFKINAS
jgi:hypothetical protein